MRISASRTRRLRTAAALLAAAGAVSGAAAAPDESRLDRLRDRVRALDDAPGAGEASLELAERLLDSLAADGADLATLYGVATTAQSRRVAEHAAEALEATRRGRDWVETELRALEAHPELAEDRELQDRRSRLAVEMLEYRTPLAEARAATLLAASAGSPAVRRELAGYAANLLRGLDLREPAWEARQLATLGAAALLGAPDGPEAALRALGACLELLDPADEPRLFVEATIGRVMAALELQGAGAARAMTRLAMTRPPFTPRDLRSAPWRLTAADALFRIGAREAARMETANGRREAMARACEGYVELLTGTEAGAESLRPLVYEKLADINWQGDPAALPTLAALALADRARREQALERAIGLLEKMVSRTDDALGPLAGDALWEYARALMDRAAQEEGAALESRRRAMASLVRIGRNHPEWRGAPEAIETAARLGAWLLAQTHGPERGPIEALQIETLRLVMQRFEDLPAIDTWRLELGRLLENAEGERALAAVSIDSPGAFAQAQFILLGRMRERMEQATGDRRREIARAIVDQAGAARDTLRTADGLHGDAGAWAVSLDRSLAIALTELDELERAARLATSSPDPGASRGVFLALCRRMVEAEARDDLDEAERVAGFAVRVGAVELDRASGNASGKEATARWITLHQARALTLVGRGAEALHLFERLERDGAGSRHVRYWKSEAILDAGDEAGAFAIWRELAGGLDAAGEYDEIFWRCWVRMLGALADRNEDGARTEAIRREISRLRSLDGSLGGSPHSERLERVLHRLDGARD